MPQSTTRSLDPQSAHLVVGDEVATEDAFKIIDEEMKRHGDFILSLKTRRNAFAPISKLPPELLSRIFAFVRENCSFYRDLLCWIKVSYVCRTWRYIALNHPSLWTKLPLAHRRWTTEMLSRSKNASLTVDVDYPLLSYLHMAHERVSSALTHSARIRHLILSNVDYTRMQKFLSGMPKQTPRLETLSLSICRGTFDPALEGTICELPSDLISTTSRLRRLELTRLKFDWGSILSESLTQFLVHEIPSFARPTKKQFWDALKRMPLLESIDLVNALPDSGTSDDDSRGVILHLSHLQSLTLTSSTPEVESFLLKISCPPTVTINIDCRGTASTLQEFTGLISWLSTTLSPLKKPRGFIRTLVIQRSSPGQGLRFQAYPEIYKNDHSKPPVPKLDLSLSFTMNPDQKPEEVFEKMLADVVGATSLQGLVSLRLDQQGSSFSARTLTETFGSLTQLRSVTAVGSIAVNLVKALDGTLPNKRSTRSKGSRRPTFSVLRSISIIAADLEFDLSFSALEDMVKNRKKRGAEVRELTLQMCSRVHREDVVELEKIVPKFVWDNLEIGYSDEEYYSDGYDYGGLYDSDMDYDDYYDLYYPF